MAPDNNLFVVKFLITDSYFGKPVIAMEGQLTQGDLVL